MKINIILNTEKHKFDTTVAYAILLSVVAVCKHCQLWLVSCMLTAVHLFSFNNNSFWKLLSVNLFSRGFAISPALNKCSTIIDYGSTVLYRINTDGKRGIVSSDCTVS